MRLIPRCNSATGNSRLIRASGWRWTNAVCRRAPPWIPRPFRPPFSAPHGGDSRRDNPFYRAEMRICLSCPQLRCSPHARAGRRFHSRRRRRERCGFPGAPRAGVSTVPSPGIAPVSRRPRPVHRSWRRHRSWRARPRRRRRCAPTGPTGSISPHWCAAHGFVPVPAEPATVGAYLASLAESHAPSTIRRRLAALGKMHRFNDLPWNPAHRDIQEPLRGLLRSTAGRRRRRRR